jgi:hypothetical protein
MSGLVRGNAEALKGLVSPLQPQNRKSTAQTRNVAVCDARGNRLKTYAIAIPEQKDGPLDGEFAEEALGRAREDSLVLQYELANLIAKVPEKLKLWK